MADTREDLIAKIRQAEADRNEAEDRAEKALKDARQLNVRLQTLWGELWRLEKQSKEQDNG